VRAVVVGGSLGGLTAALLLADLGADVEVLERSESELEQRGAGLGFLPESSRYVEERTDTDVAAISTATHLIRYLSRDGSVLADFEHRYRFTSWNALYRTLLRAFDRRRYRLGCEVVSFALSEDRVELHTGGAQAWRADLAVFADGVNSPARAVLQPEVVGTYAGYVAWRGMVPESSLGSGTRALFEDAITYYVTANSHILVYPIPGHDGDVRPGGRLVNFVWYRNYAEGADLDDLLRGVDGARREVSVPPGQVRPVHVAEARAHAEARLPGPIAEVVCSTEAPFVQVVYDVAVERMAFRRACLIGDAAFAVRPHAAAGTAKAAADAWALADALAAHPDVPDALAHWEPGQLELGRSLLERTRAIGRRSQVDGTWRPGDPELIFGLRGPGR